MVKRMCCFPSRITLTPSTDSGQGLALLRLGCIYDPSRERGQDAPRSYFESLPPRRIYDSTSGPTHRGME